MSTIIITALALVAFGLLTVRTVIVVRGLAQFIKDAGKE